MRAGTAPADRAWPRPCPAWAWLPPRCASRSPCAGPAGLGGRGRHRMLTAMRCWGSHARHQRRRSRRLTLLVPSGYTLTWPAQITPAGPTVWCDSTSATRHLHSGALSMMPHGALVVLALVQRHTLQLAKNRGGAALLKPKMTSKASQEFGRRCVTARAVGSEARARNPTAAEAVVRVADAAHGRNGRRHGRAEARGAPVTSGPRKELLMLGSAAGGIRSALAAVRARAPKRAQTRSGRR
mmetsp:Transcript_85576/g.259701  ORF Transcript_85576/g.259701 Transcript_85576/m.259701 type:complete len:240 (+) Transcript_85576:93-812(+)